MKRRDFTNGMIVSAVGSALIPATASATEPVPQNVYPRCWLVASDLAAGGLGSGAQVVSWLDRTANHYNVQHQPVIPDKNGVWIHAPPTLTLDAVNGLAAVSFNAAQKQSLFWVPGGSLDQGVSGFTAVFVCRPNTVGTGQEGYLFLTHNSDQTSRLAIIVNPNQGGVRAIIRPHPESPCEGGVRTDVPIPPAPPVPFSPVWGVLLLRVDYSTAGAAYLNVNGGSVETAPVQKFTPTTPSYMDVLCSTSNCNHLTCDIAEAAFYASCLSDAHSTALVNGLRQKYSI